MKRIITCLGTTVLAIVAATAQLNSYPESYKIEKKDIERAHKIISKPLTGELAMPSKNPDAQWYPDASLGLFMHWGIHSVAGAQPSWDMIAHYRYGGKVSPPDKYYALANRFNPQNYNPDKWLKAAKEAGFKYAVLTTKHHDGYALWPSKYGIGTRQYMNGRDLLKPYVDACRANGLKVGFYFSPRDWHYPGLMHPNEYDSEKWHDIPPVTDSVINYQNYERFLGFVLAQIEEILTRYGKIDLLWLDGMNFRGVSDMHTEQIYAWIRSIQPGIVINDRWSNIVNPDDPVGSGMRIGDFTTPFECTKPTYVPSKWWEHCDIWTSGGGGWGYDSTGTFRSYSWFFDHLVASRSLGGNFLVNAGPDADGKMHPNYYRNLEDIATWMKHSRESVLGAGPTPGVEFSNVMITTRDGNWYLHLLPEFKGQVSLKTDRRPQSVTLLRTGKSVTYSYWDGFIKFTVPADLRTGMDDVVKVQFDSSSPEVNTIQFYISPDGNDNNPGTITAPFRSLERARDVVRIARKKSPDKTIIVNIGGGTFYLKSPVVFTSEDSGNENARTIYKANKGEYPVFSGSKALEKWKLLTDKQKLDLLDSSVRNKVFVTDLKSAGISDYGDPSKAGLRPELFCNGELQTLARWPDDGLTKAGLSRGKTELPPTYIGVRGTKEGAFEYVGKRQNRWANENDARVGGYWYWDWSEECQKVKNVDTVNKIINICEPYHSYGYKDSLRYFGLNLFCEIDRPGEWYLDRSSGLLYWYPPEGIRPDQAKVTLTVFNAPYMIELKNCSYMTLQGLSFQESRGSAVLISQGSDCLISDCRIERFGLDGIHINEGTHHGISGCMLSTFGYGGIKIKGGDRKTLTPANHFVENSVVEHFSLFKRTYEPAVHIDGCGHRISNNRFSYSSSSAMRLEGNDLLIEYNRISNVVNESDDQGGIDIFYNPSYRGIVIRYNHWSDITGGTRHGAAGVRLDDMISGVVIYGNIFERCGALNFGAVQIHGGKDNVVENNLFYDCFAAVSFSTWGEKRWLEGLDSPQIRKKIYEDVNILSPLFQERYPELKDIRLYHDRNTVTGNLIVGCKSIFLKNNDSQIINNNDTIEINGKNLETFCDPGLLRSHGLKPIPFKEIGPKKNKWLKED